MPKIYYTVIFLLLCLACQLNLSAQDLTPEEDSFFLAKKKGILGRIGRMIMTNSDYSPPVKTVDPYKKYQGRIIRNIAILPVGFNNNINDTTPIKRNTFTRIADALHLNSFESTIRKNLFFQEGEPFYPLVVADNERFLREQPFLRDAIIKVVPAGRSGDSVNILVLTRDIFSIGGSLSSLTPSDIRVSAKEENIGGSGNRVEVALLYENDRKPSIGLGVEYLRRNIAGSFVNWATGFKTFNETFNNSGREDRTYYTKLEKPLVSRYMATTGGATVAYHTTTNAYWLDSIYNNNHQYSYINTDLWAGFNFGYNSGKKKDSENRLRHFVAARGFYNIFKTVPDRYINAYDYRYANLNGALFSYSLYRQNFYRTNFIYGFGRNEDVPEGINASIISGYTNKEGVKRGYFGLEFDATSFNRKGYLYSYKVKTGGFRNQNEWQDISVLLAIDHFTRLHSLDKYWFNRSYMSLSYARLAKRMLNEPLFLESEFGLPFYRTGMVEGLLRGTIKAESVFYHLKKIAGFRLAPFVFSGLSIIQPPGSILKKSIGYPSFGAGVRTRNENLVFGTIELRGYFLPRVADGFRNWKVELSTNLKFKYNSNFIHKPDFITAN